MLTPGHMPLKQKNLIQSTGPCRKDGRPGFACSLLPTEATVLSVTTLYGVTPLNKILLTGWMKVLPHALMLVERTGELPSGNLKVLAIHGLPPHTHKRTNGYGKGNQWRILWSSDKMTTDYNLYVFNLLSKLSLGLVEAPDRSRMGF